MGTFWMRHIGKQIIRLQLNTEKRRMLLHLGASKAIGNNSAIVFYNRLTYLGNKMIIDWSFRRNSRLCYDMKLTADYLDWSHRAAAKCGSCSSPSRLTTWWNDGTLWCHATLEPITSVTSFAGTFSTPRFLGDSSNGARPKLKRLIWPLLHTRFYVKIREY